jgi:hypothetical protein
MRFTVACVFAAFFASCDGSRPLPMAPTSGLGLTPTFTVSGVVTAAGLPAAGVKVLVVDQEPATFAITDGSGHYSIPARTAQSWGMAPLVSASKPGYFTEIRFTDANYLPIAGDRQLDFQLQPLRHIALGEVVRQPVAPSACSHWGYGTGPCQRFAVTVPAAGTLDVTVSAPVINFDLDIVRPDGTFAAYIPFPSSSPVRARIPVTAGATYEIRMIDASSGFELTTAVR